MKAYTFAVAFSGMLAVLSVNTAGADPQRNLELERQQALLDDVNAQIQKYEEVQRECADMARSIEGGRRTSGVTIEKVPLMPPTPDLECSGWDRVLQELGDLRETIRTSIDQITENRVPIESRIGGRNQPAQTGISDAEGGGEAQTILAAVGCSSADIRALIASGKSDAEIDAICGSEDALPAWLNGLWTVTQHLGSSNVAGFGYPATSEVWEITVSGDDLSISEVRDPHLGASAQQKIPLEVRNVEFDGKSLGFQIRTRDLGTIKTATYRLSVGSDDDSLEGTWESKDTGSYGLPPLEMAGRVVMIKE